MSKNEVDLDKKPIAETLSLADQVPVIDISELLIDSSGSAARQAVDQIASACRSWGFFQVINHGISSEKFSQVWSQTHALFAFAEEKKQSIMRSRENPWGFYNNELTKNQRDKKEVFDFTHEGIDTIYQQSNQWPAGQPLIKSVLQDYFSACSRLSLTLLEAFCVGLELPSTFMHGDFETNHTGFLRLNYYPVKDPMQNQTEQHQQVADLGVHHHTDAGALTVLLQDDIGGLQVYRDGFWHNVPPVENALVINTGDMMQVWSNDIYQAAIHRVLAMKNRDRYSLPFFFNPAATAQVYPLPSVISEQVSARYNLIKWADFRGKRTDGDYADYGAEVQISQFSKQEIL
ncbi:MAG: isopenicillin N synthase-like dioxygenase [Gammaproteobacteria bacterium]